MTGAASTAGQATGFDATTPRAALGYSVYRRFIDGIWHVEGSLPLAPGQSVDDAFERLDPLFRQTGTTRERAGDTLSFQKEGQAAQDKMAVFDRGTLRVEHGATSLVLRYRLASRALLFCFLAPLLFLAFAQATIVLGKFEKARTEAKGKKPEVKKPPVVLNPIDKALGAPEPDPPKKKSKKDEDDKKPSPTPGYVFAGIFAALYAVGRVLEDRRIRRLFRKRLLST
ncbi:hypothetical protein [Sphingomonas sp. PP-CC-1A-547]|uniref:hypothetical protein n=1 Tax=unclassified Sphingomonas TaxID=196159 RepID=UPI000FF28D63|nr:hypothetical protein [Sphingomonas sp. PP-CC-1A-547]RKE54360.1 hypothetical protein C8J39_0072 [Sphingomonas sp. PP-CC-1A-547]TCM01617.1 hypothetical protein C8J41_11722 [Sphingomonas sp. PP-CC-3G-468]